MRKQFSIIFMSACSLGYAQIGVNTTDITSTLTVQGSISANYREVTDTSYYLKEDDYNVGFANRSNQDGVFYMPSAENAFGRMYNIKNLTKNQELEIKVQGGRSFKFGGLEFSNSSSYTLYPGQSMSVVADKRHDWVVYAYNSSGSKYVESNVNINERTVIRMGNLSFRIAQPNLPNTGDMYLQIMSHASLVTHISCSTSLSTLTTSNSKTEFRNAINHKYLPGDKWVYAHKELGDKTNPIMNTKYVQSQVSIITIERTGEMYRVTCSVFDGSGLKKYIGILVERLH